MSETILAPELAPRRGALGKLKARLRDRGMIGTLRKLWADRVFRKRHAFVMARPISADIPDVRGPDNDTTLLIVRRIADLPPLTGWLEGRDADYADLLERGSTGCFALHAGRAVAACWVNTADFKDRNLGLRVRVPQGHAYAHSMLVDHAHRDGGLARKMGAEMIRFLNESGITHAFTYVVFDNEASYRFQRALCLEESDRMMAEYFVFGKMIQRQRRHSPPSAPAAWRQPRVRKA